MYNDEIFDALEDAYNDGYNQAILDTYDDSYIDDEDMYDEVYEDVDMFDDNYFEAMEGPAREYRHKQNEGKSREQIQRERMYNYDLGDDRYLIDKDRSRFRGKSNPHYINTHLDTKYNKGHGVDGKYSSNNLIHNLNVYEKRNAAINQDYRRGKITRDQHKTLSDANNDMYQRYQKGARKISDSQFSRKMAEH